MSTSEETLPAITPSDLEAAGFPVGMSMAAGLAVFLNPILYKRCSSIAVRMADAATDGMLPKHLAGKPAACFAIISRALAWNLDPFAVGQCTYQTPNGTVGFEGKLIAAILENSKRLEGGLKYRHEGDWSRVKGKFKIETSQRGGKYPVPTWTQEDAKGLYVVVSAQVKNEPEPRELKVDLDECFPLNSPLWATSPSVQICYLAARRFANIAMPGVLMGIPFDIDPTGFYGEPMTDVTPKKADAPVAPANEFARKPKPSAREDAAFPPSQTATAPAASATPSPEPATADQSPQREETPATQAPTQGAAQDAQAATGTASQPEPSTQAETARAAGEVIEETGDEETPRQRGDRLLAICNDVRDVADLRVSIAEELDDTAKADWHTACDLRTREIVDGGKAGRKAGKKP